MYCSRVLLRNQFCLYPVSLCKCSNKTLKKPNVIKNFNTENKYLYGKLLETQKQRRKTKDENVSTKKAQDESTQNSVSENALNKKEPTKYIKSSIKKSKLLADSDNQIKPVSATIPSNVPIAEISGHDIHSESVKMKTSKNRTNKLKSAKLKQDNVMTPSILNDFVFKPKVAINESNYLLENKKKVVASNTIGESISSFSFTDPAVKSYIKFPSVSKVIEETMSETHKSILNKWRQNMIKELGEDGFNKYSQDLKSRGSEFHTVVRDAVLGHPTGACSEVAERALLSLAWVLELVSCPLAIESIVAHPKLEYKGIPDCVASFRNVPVVIDWKLSDKPKKDLKDTYDAPVQITAYMGALNHDPNYKFGVNHGLVVVAYTSGDPCDVFLLAPKHCQIYWKHWLARLDKFKARSHLHIDHDIDETILG